MPDLSPVILVILDGFGISSDRQYNAIYTAKTPTWDALWQHYPHSLLEASGEYVGLPAHQMGNSEVGHMTLGAGRIIPQDLRRINNAIQTKAFFKNPVLKKQFENLNATQTTLHLIGLVSPGGVHAHEDHLIAIIDFAHQNQFKHLCVHAILDGRDTAPKSALTSLHKIERHLHKTQTGSIGSISGRFYAMDRNQRWDRIEPVYHMLTSGQSNYRATTATDALEQAYQRGETDEFVQPTLIQSHFIQDQDSLLFFNFRTDRIRQLAHALLDVHFNAFKRKKRPILDQAISFTEYEPGLINHIIFPRETIQNTLGERVSQHKLKQFRIAETEKYAHVTFFLNAGIEDPFPGEQRHLIPSPTVETYDLKPEMSAPAITEHLTQAIARQAATLYICNFANADMVGHTGNFKATVKAIECLDDCLKQIIEASKKRAGHVFITSDHGNAECLFDPKSTQPHTAHTNNPVPLVYVGSKTDTLKSKGALADVAPTLLALLNIEKPNEMTGENLLI